MMKQNNNRAKPQEHQNILYCLPNTLGTITLQVYGLSLCALRTLSGCMMFWQKDLRYIYFVQYINVGVERNLQRSIFIPHKRDMIGGK